jgi:hypothetical protein
MGGSIVFLFESMREICVYSLSEQVSLPLNTPVPRNQESMKKLIVSVSTLVVALALTATAGDCDKAKTAGKSACCDKAKTAAKASTCDKAKTAAKSDCSAHTAAKSDCSATRTAQAKRSSEFTSKGGARLIRTL